MSVKKTAHSFDFALIESAAQLGLAAKKRRASMGLTQPELALSAGCGLRFIVDLEAGKPTVRFEHVLRVVHALGLTMQLTMPISQSDD